MVFCICHLISDDSKSAVSPGNISTTPDMMVNSVIGDEVDLRCTALGGPDNVYSWTRLSDGTVVANQTMLRVMVESAYDGSIYRCRVENAAGSVSRDITLYG